MRHSSRWSPATPGTGSSLKSEPLLNVHSIVGDVQRGSSVNYWAAVIGTLIATTVVLVWLNMPSAYLLAGVISGAGVSLRTRQERPLPKGLQYIGLALIGVASGAEIDAGVVNAVAARPGLILGTVAATLAVTMASGQVLRLSRSISPPTAMFASIAGAASGVIAVVREVGGDDAVVMTIQYVRVLAVLVTVPVAVNLMGTAGSGDAPAASHPLNVQEFVFTGVCVAVGLALARKVTFSASRLVLPLLCATGLSLSGKFPSAGVPAPLLALGYALIGLMVGLSMTSRTLRILMRLMPLVLVQLVLSLGACAAIAVGLSRLTGISNLDSYIMTTPGGLPAISAIALGSGASVGLVITVQLVRVFAAILVASILGALYARKGPAPEPSTDTA
jgi:membrane AbrB-like protein